MHFSDFVVGNYTLCILRCYFSYCNFQSADINQNQDVSDKEVMECLKIVMAIVAASDFTAEFSGFTKAIFRIFDEDRNGALHVDEIAKVMFDFLLEIHRLVKGVSMHFQMAFLSNRESVHDLLDTFIVQSSENQWSPPISIEDIESYLLDFFTPPKLSHFIKELCAFIPNLDEALESLKDCLLPAYESFRNVTCIIDVQSHSFFEYVAQNNISSTTKMIGKGLECLNNIFDGISQHGDSFTKCIMGLTTFIITKVLDDMPEDNPLKFILIQSSSVKQILDEILTSLAEYLREAGTKKYLEAFLSIFADETGNVDPQQLLAFQVLIEVVIALIDPDEFQCEPQAYDVIKNRLKDSIATLLASLDTNHNCTLTTLEILTFVDKIIQFVLSTFDATIDLFAKTASSIVKPFLTLVFDVKSQIIGGSLEELTFFDISSMALALIMVTGEFRVLQFAMDILGDKKGNIDQEKLVPVCSSLLRMIFGSPPVRMQSAAIFRCVRRT